MDYELAVSDTPRWVAEHLPDALVNSELFTFNIRLPSGDTIKVRLFHDMDIIYENLEQHLEQIPAQYMYWAAVYSEMRSHVSVLETKVDLRKAAVTHEILDRFKAKGIRLTDKQLVYLINGDQKLTQLSAELAIAHKKTGKLYHMVQAMQMRSEHCRSLSGFKRQDKEQSGHQT